MRWTRQLIRAGLLVAAVAASGCGTGTPTVTQVNPQPPAPYPPDAEAEEKAKVAAELAKLSPEDRAEAEAQEWCPISSDERLGTMGPPVKIEVKGQPVFLCCGGCKKQALANPDKTLAKVAQLKARKKKDQTPKS